MDLPADLLAKLAAMARDDPSGLVRLVLASTLQRLPVDRRVELARALLSHAEDAADHNLPALIWTGLIPVADADPGCALAVAGGRLPAAGRGPADRPKAGRGHRVPARAVECVAGGRCRTGRAEFRSQVVGGLVDALAGIRKARKPAAWDAFQARLDATGRPGACRAGARAERALRRWASAGRSEAAGPG